MAKTATIHVRIDEEIKEEAVEVLNAIGLSTADAITLYFRQIAINNAIPFSLSATKQNKTNFDRVNDIKKEDVKAVLSVIPDSVDELWIFGSAITEFCREDSDIDICVIGDNITREDRRVLAHAPRRGMDLLNVTHEEFERERGDKNSIYHAVFNKGLLLYKKE